LAQEIECFSGELKKFGIDFSDLPRVCPKQVRSRELCSKLAREQDALVELLQAESTSGYLKPEANVVLTVFSSDSAVQSSLLSELRGVVDSSIALYSDQITAEYHAVDESTVNGAHGHGVTAGKYLYLQELQALAPDTDISKLSHHSIEQLKGEIETCKQEHAEEGGTAGHDDRHEQEETCDPS
jgi:hypothetical protein